MTGKSNLFVDKEYEEMEWLSKAIEPYIFYVNELLAKLPDRYDLSYEDVMTQVESNYNAISKTESILQLLSNVDVDRSSVDNIDLQALLMCFTLEVDPNTTLDLHQRVILGNISLIKDKVALEDEDVRAAFLTRFQSIFWKNSHNETLTNLNELMDILGIEEARKSRSTSKKIQSVSNFMEKVIKEDLWKIRNEQLIVSLATWMADFVSTGNLAALSNITRLKCMTYNQHPLYSMQETV
jgi:hypothetical protein